MACVAWPTCGLAITEAERALPTMIDQLEVELAKLGLSSDVFTLRMTGCPNGCSRPYNSDIGLVGKAHDKYTVFVGGRLLGNRMNFVYKDLVPTAEVVPTLMPLFVFYKQARRSGKRSGIFVLAVASPICSPGPSATPPPPKYGKAPRASNKKSARLLQARRRDRLA